MDASNVPSHSGMLTDSLVVPNGTTPRRIKPMQALSGLFRTPTRLHTPTTVGRYKKRTRTCVSSLSPSSPSTPGTLAPPAVVLQTYSVSTDSIVLTSLPSAPFCCHEDLLTMSRGQLEGVVRTLNTRLPPRMRIGPENSFWKNSLQGSATEHIQENDGLSAMSETEMRRRVEELVGIRAVMGNSPSKLGLGLDTRGQVPPAPRAVRTRDAAWRPSAKTPWEMDVDDTEGQTDDLGSTMDDGLMGSSPLASRSKSSIHSRGRSGTLSYLPILQEENEGGETRENDEEDNEGRPFKRQRMSPGGVTLDSLEGPRVIQEVRGSRLIEDIDISGSPFLLEEDYALSDGSVDPEEKVVATMGGSAVCATTTEEGMQAPLQRRRSVRIKEIALKRAASVGTRRNPDFGAKGLKSSIFRSKTSSFCRSPGDDSPTTERPDVTRKDSSTPQTFAIRLPFTSTPPRQKPGSSVWSARRILRSHSQRLRGSGQPIDTKVSLGRSQSERHPLTSGLAFVTIDRPRYRFPQRNLNGTKAAKWHQELHTPILVSPVQGTDQRQHDPTISTEHKPEKDIGNAKEFSAGSTTANHRIFTGSPPRTLRDFPSPRSRAFSTSTIASVLSNGSSGKVMVEEGVTPKTNTVLASSNGGAEHVSEALGRMAMDSCDTSLSKDSSFGIPGGGMI